MNVWNASGKGQARMLPDLRQASQVVFNPDGTLMVTLEENRCRLWTTAAWRPIRESSGPVQLHPVAAALSADAKQLAYACRPGEVRLVELPELRLLATVREPQGATFEELRFRSQGGPLEGRVAGTLEWRTLRAAASNY